MTMQVTDRCESLKKCQEGLGYSFKDVTLLERALVHTSCRLEYNGSNERLEFLGDAILGMVISEHLYKTFPGCPEGELTRIKSVVVSQALLAKVGKRLKLGHYITVGKGLSDRQSFPRSLIANVFEAIIAAIYLDRGLQATHDFILTHLGEEIKLVSKDEHEKNYKSLLQQYCQKHLTTTPHYKVIKQEGPDHGKTFEVMVVIKDEEYGRGKGNSKKEAEQSAAKAALQAVGKGNPAEDSL
jgi:ribonuclease-3